MNNLAIMKNVLVVQDKINLPPDYIVISIKMAIVLQMST